MNYLVDGYNLGFSDQQIAPWIQRGDSDRAIQLVIQKIQASISKNSKAVAVFDGKHGYFSKKYGTRQIQVIFSKKPETADDIIRRLIRRQKDPQSWHVVSSDHEIQNTARDMGANIIKSNEFILTDSKHSPASTPAMEPDSKYNPGSEDIDYWLKQFGGEDN